MQSIFKQMTETDICGIHIIRKLNSKPVSSTKTKYSFTNRVKLVQL